MVGEAVVAAVVHSQIVVAVADFDLVISGIRTSVNLYCCISTISKFSGRCISQFLLRQNGNLDTPSHADFYTIH